MINLRTSIFIIVIFVTSMAENMVSAISCDVNLTEPDFYIHGLCFSPYVDGQKPPEYVSPEQIQERLAIITQKHHTDWIRTYSATYGLEEIPEEANSLGLKVAMGIWIRDGNEQEVNNLVAAAQAGYVDMAVVGNEELYAGATSESQLIADINYVHQQLIDAGCGDIPVTTPEPFDTIFDLSANGECTARYPNLIEAVDVVTVYIYPFHDGIHIDVALAYLIELYQYAVAAVKAIDPNKEVIIGETGWPSEGETKIAAKPSPMNAARYFYDVQCWAARNDVNVFYFSAYDEQWKAPPEYEAHWGVWESDGTIKPDFLPSVIFCEDFDPPHHPFCAEPNDVAWEPNIISADSNSDGDFLRILYDGFQVHFSSVAFDRAAQGPFDRIVVEFDFRMYSTGAGADGFSVLLIPTSSNGPNGCQQHGSSFNAEQPLLRNTFGVGFEICKQWPCSGPDAANRIYISWDMHWSEESPIEISVDDIDLNSGEFHRARIELRCTEGDTALVNVSLTPDIYDVNHPAPITVAEDVVIGNFFDPYKPYENRIEFAGRNGGLTTNADVDNIYASYSREFCGYQLEGDFDGNCRVEFIDFAIMAQNWLIDCRLTPGNPACVAK